MGASAVSTEPVVVGNLRIPAENYAEYVRVTDEMHEFVVAGKAIPKELRRRAYLLEGMAPADAEWFAEHGEMGECGDTHER